MGINMVAGNQNIVMGCPWCGRKDEHVHIGNGNAYKYYYAVKPVPGDRNWVFTPGRTSRAER